MESSLPRFPQLLSVPIAETCLRPEQLPIDLRACPPEHTQVGYLENPWRATIRANCTVFRLHFDIRDPIVRILNGIKVNKLQALLQLGCWQTALMPNMILNNSNQHQPNPTYTPAWKEDVSSCDMSPNPTSLYTATN
jgi:hypothetical protein